MSTCSEYFEQMFEQTDCKNPVIVLKDIKSEELESLLSYMYVGEVNVVQEKLAGLIKAAECLKIKGLAVPDEEPQPNKVSNREKRSADTSVSSDAKRRKEEVRQSYNNRNSEERRKSSDNNKYRNSNNSNTVDNSHVGGNESNDSLASNNQNAVAVKEEASGEQFSEAPQEVTLDDPQELVKQEPNDMDAVYIDDSNSASESKDMLMDNFDDGDGQQHFMDELLGQNSDQGNMGGVGNFNEVGEGSAGGSQQHMVFDALRIEQEQQSLRQFLFLASRKGGQGAQAADSGQSASGGADAALPYELLDLSSLVNPAGSYNCPACPKVIVDKPHFKRHYMIHTGEKPHKCSYCDYRASRKEEVNYHTFRMHSQKEASIESQFPIK